MTTKIQKITQVLSSRVFGWVKGKISAPKQPGLIDAFAFTGNDPRTDIQRKYGYKGDLLDIYASHSGGVVHKWHHYLPIYDRYFSAYRDSAPKLLEIGVSKGGSLAMWRRYFGPNATIFGIDINPSCRQFDGTHGSVRIGSQADPEFLNAVVSEMGGIDIVLDDGSHHMAHINTSLETLFPRLSTPGLYMIEDLHTAYWSKYGGGMSSEDNFFRFLQTMVDDMHHWYHEFGQGNAQLTASLSGIHIHDSIVVLDKSAVHRPTHSKVS